MSKGKGLYVQFDFEDCVLKIPIKRCYKLQDKLRPELNLKIWIFPVEEEKVNIKIKLRLSDQL